MARRVTGMPVIGMLALGIVLASCGGGKANLVTSPKPGQEPSPARGSVTPFGAPPVQAPPTLRGVASSYYEGGGPDPERQDGSRPACLLMLPTSLRAAPIHPVPKARFNIFDEFEVTWSLAAGRGRGLVLFVYPPGDSSDHDFFSPAATVSTLPDGTELRTAPQRPRATLIQVPTQNCAYELEAHGPVSSSALDNAVHSLRLVFDP